MQLSVELAEKRVVPLSQVHLIAQVFKDLRWQNVHIPIDSVIYVQIDRNYADVVTSERKYLLEMPLQEIEERFSDQFIRISRSMLVSRLAITNMYCVDNGKKEKKTLIAVRGVSERLEVARRRVRSFCVFWEERKVELLQAA